MAAAIRPTRRPIEATMVIMALSVRVGSSLAMDNAAKALQFQSVAASLNGREHQPSKLRVQGRALPRSPAQKENAPKGAVICCHDKVASHRGMGIRPASPHAPALFQHDCFGPCGCYVGLSSAAAEWPT